MRKYSKKVLLVLVFTMILSTSVGYAQGKYAVYNNRYSNNRFTQYLFNNWHWDYNWNTTEVKDKPVIEGKPVIEQKPTVNKPVIEEKPAIDKEPDYNVAPSNSMEMEVVRLVNIERQKAGLVPLKHSQELSKVARTKSEDMGRNNYFSHNSPTYGDPFAMMRSFGINYTTAGENIAQGYYSAESVVRGWMNSSGHRQNILNPSFGTMGVGYADINGSTYWTQMFTN